MRTCEYCINMKGCVEKVQAIDREFNPEFEGERHCIWFKAYMTNGDKIRAMTDEELCAFILDKQEKGHCFNNKCYHNDPDKGCDDCTLEWLKQEVAHD